MPTHVECKKCGKEAVVSYVRIPDNQRDADGKILTPADWLHVIDCPQSGSREQNGTISPPVTSQPLLVTEE